MGRSNTGRFSPADVDDLFEDIGLPRPGHMSNLLARLERDHLVSRRVGHGRVWTLTPVGRAQSEALASDLDLAALAVEGATTGGSRLGGSVHPVIPPTLAPPDLIGPLHDFLDHHPFDRNVLGMTRFPDEGDDTGPDPVGPAIQAARDICGRHGMEFHLASDRAIHDDLWSNVAAHMWASRYGVAFFEDRRGRGVNYNLTIEVGSMLMTGRRCALLKDKSIDRLPTDLVGRIYKGVDFDSTPTIEAVVHSWIRDDLGLGACAECPPNTR